MNVSILMTKDYDNYSYFGLGAGLNKVIRLGLMDKRGIDTDTQ